MKSTNGEEPTADIVGFILATFRNTVASSKSRIVIFCIVLFLQFFAVSFLTFLWSWNYPGTYSGMKQKESVQAVFWVSFGLVKYFLLLTLIVRSPKESTRKRRFAKYGVLFLGFYFWAVLDLVFTAIESDGRQTEMAAKSFQENKVPVYGKVVFSSYKRDERSGKNLVSVAEKLSRRTNGYLLIVQIDSTYYPNSELKNHLGYFNDYCEHGKKSTNIPPQIPDLPRCIKFDVDFIRGLKQLPDIPDLTKYVKILYDPKENGIQLFIDSSTMKTPVFDSVSLKLQVGK